MASTITRKPHPATKVADMTTTELREMLESLIDRKMSEWASDPRIACRRAEIRTNASVTRREYRAGKTRRGTTKDLLAELE
jgi:hypothetical protein